MRIKLSVCHPSRYALFLFDSYVTFADLTDGQYEVIAQLKLEPNSPSVIPKNVIFSDWGGEDSSVGRFAYLTATGSSDIYALNLLEEPDEEGASRLKPSINQLPSGLNPERMIRYRGADGLSLNTLSIILNARLLVLALSLHIIASGCMRTAGQPYLSCSSNDIFILGSLFNCLQSNLTRSKTCSAKSSISINS
jgi:hypothetical protein